MRLWQATRKLRNEEREGNHVHSTGIRGYHCDFTGYCCISVISNYQFFFPRMKKELPSGIGTIFSLGPEKSGFRGATPTMKTQLQYTLSVKMVNVSLLPWLRLSNSPSSPSMTLSSSFSCQSSSSFYIRDKISAVASLFIHIQYDQEKDLEFPHPCILILFLFVLVPLFFLFLFLSEWTDVNTLLWCLGYVAFICSTADLLP